MDAVLTAGGTPAPGDPLYSYTRGRPKAMLEIAGKPMIQWVLDALTQSGSIDRIVVVGLDEKTALQSSKISGYLPDHGGLLENTLVGVRKLVEDNPDAHHVLFVSSDIPAITAEMVDWVVQSAADGGNEDGIYNLITRDVMERRFPNSRRSYTRLRDIEVCGGDMNVIRAVSVTNNDALWHKIIAARKNIFKMAALVGFDTLVLLALRLITLEEGVRRAARRLHIQGRVVLCPYAEVGMDIDKPHQFEMVSAYMEQRDRSPAGV